MRAISLVNRIEFQFRGNVARDAIALGDVDNDGCFELAVGSSNGEVAIFKGRERVQTISDLSFVSCIAIGDVLNKGRNCLVIVTADGWCYIYENLEDGCKDGSGSNTKDEDNNQNSADPKESKETVEPSADSPRPSKPQLTCIHIQRIPANAKNLVLGDIDNDGHIEMILGLTDRVVRSYRWIDDPNKAQTTPPPDNRDLMQHLGKLVALNKWECANQIGSITLHRSNAKTALLIAQPGGTFMRIRCGGEDALLEASGRSDRNGSISSVDYQFLGIARMRSQNISTEILGDFTSNSGEKSPYAVATLDGTIMLVQDEVILWAIAVDHQIFALNKMDVTGNGCDDIVVCAWDGQTYILDQEKNVVRFSLNEPVQAFHSGYFNVSANETAVTALVYVTFKNTIILYFDMPLQELVCRRYEPSLELLERAGLEKGADRKERKRFLENLLYSVKL